MNYPSIDRITDLQEMIADFASIKRMVKLADNNDLENDVEHSFGLAITCWFLHSKIVPDMDLSKILRYALAHDIVEIYAGDTFVFDTVGLASKDKREKESLTQLESEWSDFNELTDYAQGYMEKADEEARFVKAVDKLLPVIMVELGEKDVFWNKHQLTLKDEAENKRSILVSEQVAPYYDMLMQWLDDRGNIPKA